MFHKARLEASYAMAGISVGKKKPIRLLCSTILQLNLNAEFTTETDIKRRKR